jgi:hypothetical protein
MTMDGPRSFEHRERFIGAEIWPSATPQQAFEAGGDPRRSAQSYLSNR